MVPYMANSMACSLTIVACGKWNDEECRELILTEVFFIFTLEPFCFCLCQLNELFSFCTRIFYICWLVYLNDEFILISAVCSEWFCIFKALCLFWNLDTLWNYHYKNRFNIICIQYPQLIDSWISLDVITLNSIIKFDEALWQQRLSLKK